MTTFDKKPQGVMLAVIAYGVWSGAAVYFKALDFVSAIEVLCHRVIWSFLLAVVILYFMGRYKNVTAVFKSRRQLTTLIVSTILIALNWGVFIWAVQSGKILSASLGYYINPLLSILLGVIFLGERLSVSRRLAASLCVLAVVFEVLSFGRLPWVALFLASTFGLYGLVRKKLGIDSFTGLAFETGLLFPLAVGYLLWSDNPAATFIATTWRQDALLILAGLITTIPMVCFTAAANRISLTALGFFQYIAPSGMFLLAVFVYDETISTQKLVTFAIIWSALALLVASSIRSGFSARNSKKARALPPL